MKLFVKIFLFVLVAFVANVKVIGAATTFIDIQKVTTFFSFLDEAPEIDFKVIENDLANCCQNEQDLVDYRNWGAGVDAKAAKGAPSSFLNSLNKTISAKKQARHLVGTAGKRKGYLNSINDAQAVLDAVHTGKATFLGTSKAGHYVFKFKGVTGTNVNLGAGISGQPTNVFMIKGTSNPSVVPTSPLWKP